ncbi:MAG: lamin tail domain-containing protein, partial [Pseudomonadota bacterium]
MVAGATSTVFFNEIHYSDNGDPDTGEFIEIANTAATDLSGWTVVVYDTTGGNATPLATATLSGSDLLTTLSPSDFLSNAGGTPLSEFSDFSPTFALIDDSGTVIQFVSFGLSSSTGTDSGDPTFGLSSIPLGIEEDGTDAPGLSLQLEGTGSVAADFSEVGPIAATPGAQNTGQTLVQITTPDIVINEILYDPATDLTGDANGDGTRDASEDEFIEIVNTGAGPIDISGFTLSDDDGGDFAFPSGTILAAGQAAVLFGGGTPLGNVGDGNPNSNFGGALVFVDDGNIGSGLSNSGDLIELRDDTGTVVDSVGYGSAGSVTGGSDQSITRDPDATGGFVDHSAATGSGGALFSPGTQIDGTAFAAPVTILFEEDFDEFSGAGFAATPGVGQLDSDIFTTTGFGTNVTSGGDFTSGDPARGTTDGTGETTGGIYALDQGSGDFAFYIQPGGSDFTPGTIDILITNTGDATDTFNFALDLLFNNDQARANSLGVTATSTFAGTTSVTDVTTTSPEAADANGVVEQAVSGVITFDAPIEMGETCVFSITGDDVSGSGSRDEFGFDNLVISSGGSAPPPPPGPEFSIADAQVLEGDSGGTTLQFTISLS